MSSNLIVSIFSVVKKLYVDGSSKYIRISEGLRVKLYFINENGLYFTELYSTFFLIMYSSSSLSII